MFSLVKFKPKDLVPIPWMIAMALQADGWYLRSDIIWSKSNPMPESVTDRPTKAHEYIFLLTKSAHYFYDAEAVKEAAEYGRREWGGGRIDYDGGVSGERRKVTTKGADPSAGRNLRSVWTIATEGFPGAHFATFPSKLIEPCILAGTSGRGCCPTCGKPWERVVERTKMFQSGSGRSGNPIAGKQDLSASETNSTPDIRMGPCIESRTIDWHSRCNCGGNPVPCIVLDPFMGSGTVAKVALKSGRNYVGIELNPAYIEMAERRLRGTNRCLPSGVD